MYRPFPAPNPVVDFANQQDAYRKHLSAVASAKSLIDTSPPRPNPRLEVWRKRVARERRMRQALAGENDRQVRQTERSHAQSRKAVILPSEFEDDFIPEDWIAELPRVDADLAKAPKPLLQIKRTLKLVQPQNSRKETKSSVHPVRLLKPLVVSERIRFDGTGELEVLQQETPVEEGFGDDWDDSDESEGPASNGDSDSGSIEEHVEAEAEDNEEEEW
jgi:hypothetical protein